MIPIRYESNLIIISSYLLSYWEGQTVVAVLPGGVADQWYGMLVRCCEDSSPANF